MIATTGTHRRTTHLAHLIAFHARPPVRVPRRPATSRRVSLAWLVRRWGR